MSEFSVALPNLSSKELKPGFAFSSALEFISAQSATCSLTVFRQVTGKQVHRKASDKSIIQNVFYFHFCWCFFKKNNPKIEVFFNHQVVFFFNNEKIANYEKTSVHILNKKENKLILN